LCFLRRFYVEGSIVAACALALLKGFEGVILVVTDACRLVRLLQKLGYETQKVGTKFLCEGSCVCGMAVFWVQFPSRVFIRKRKRVLMQRGGK
jgi:hypothetical protein